MWPLHSDSLHSYTPHYFRWIEFRRQQAGADIGNSAWFDSFTVCFLTCSDSCCLHISAKNRWWNWFCPVFVHPGWTDFQGSWMADLEVCLLLGKRHCLWHTNGMMSILKRWLAEQNQTRSGIGLRLLVVFLYCVHSYLNLFECSYYACLSMFSSSWSFVLSSSCSFSSGPHCSIVSHYSVPWSTQPCSWNFQVAVASPRGGDSWTLNFSIWKAGSVWWDLLVAVWRVPLFYLCYTCFLYRRIRLLEADSESSFFTNCDAVVDKLGYSWCIKPFES